MSFNSESISGMYTRGLGSLYGTRMIGSTPLVTVTKCAYCGNIYPNEVARKLMYKCPTCGGGLEAK